jgi:hypothetical protein
MNSSHGQTGQELIWKQKDRSKEKKISLSCSDDNDGPTLFTVFHLKVIKLF